MRWGNPRGKKQVFGVKPHENIRKCAQYVSVINCLRVTCDRVKLSYCTKQSKYLTKRHVLHKSENSIC